MNRMINGDGRKKTSSLFRNLPGDNKKKKNVIETLVATGGGSKGLTLTGLSRTLASSYGRGFREPSEF